MATTTHDVEYRMKVRELRPGGVKIVDVRCDGESVTRRALLDAMLANPGDDLPRIVFADHIEECGESERAEFIRLMIKWDGERSELIDRLHLGTYRPGPPPFKSKLWGYTGHNPDHVAMYRRGFIAELRGPLAALLEHGPAICREHPVEGVSVTDRRTFKSGGNDTYYIGGYDPMPSRTWKHLDGHPSPQAAMNALNAAVLAEIRERAK